MPTIKIISEGNTITFNYQLSTFNLELVSLTIICYYICFRNAFTILRFLRTMVSTPSASLSIL